MEDSKSDRSLPWLAFRTTKGTEEAVSRMVRGAVHLHHADYIPGKVTAFFVANAATELELLVLPHALQKLTGKDVWTLMPLRMAGARARKLIEAAGAIITEHPDPDKVIRSLLQGTHAWVAIDEAPVSASGNGFWHVSGRGIIPRLLGASNGAAAVSIPPHVAGFAARAEAYRQLLQQNGHSEEKAEEIARRLKIEPLTSVTDRQMLLVPLKVNYFPFPDGLNGFLAPGPAEPVEEGSTTAPKPEDAPPIPEVDIDIVFGKPVALGDCFPHETTRPDENDDADRVYAPSETNIHKAALNATAYCAKLDTPLTALNVNHVLAGILSRSWQELATETGARSLRTSAMAIRHRVFLAAVELARAPRLHGPNWLVNSDMDEVAHRVVRSGPVPAFDNLLAEFLRDGVGKGNRAFLPGWRPRHLAGNHPILLLLRELASVPEAERVVARIARMPQALVAWRVRQHLMDEEKQAFRQDYETHFQEGLSKEPAVGEPFLLKPAWPVGAVVLIHGYMAAPLEMRALAEYLYQRQYAAFAVRLKGHGTSPTDLAAVSWNDWYDSICRGLAIARAVSDEVIVGGFSMGAGLALLTAGRHGDALKGVFAINAPLYLQNPAARFAPSIVRVNALLRSLHMAKPKWEYLENAPENRHINYTSNPVTGVAQLGGAMAAMEGALKDIACPALVLQGSRDPVVNSGSGAAIFEKIGTPYKELVVLERDNHGIINGDRSREVFDRIYQFLTWARGRNREN